MKKIALFLLPLLAILLLPEQTYAYDFMWDDSKYVFQGIGSSVSIQLPIYDKDGRDMWVIDGYVYVKAAGKSEQTLLHYKSEGDISGSAKWYSTILIITRKHATEESSNRHRCTTTAHLRR